MYIPVLSKVKVSDDASNTSVEYMLSKKQNVVLSETTPVQTVKHSDHFSIHVTLELNSCFRIKV